ncbi:MAG: SAM-dependent methyltransferase [Kiritimatiellia bacterium]|jgi:SAM-dependent methyltransferase
MTAWHEDPEFWTLFGPALGQSADAQRDVDGFIELCRPPDGARVLDLGCGLGHHSLCLARKGLSVTALDTSAHRLRRLSSIARDEHLDVEIVRRDMRLFHRPHHFHGILWAGDAVGLFHDAQTEHALLHTLWDALQTGGRLVIVARGKELAAKTLNQQSHMRIDDETVVLADRVIDDGFGSTRTRFTRISPDSERHAECTWKLYSGAQLTAALTTAGFTKVRIYGGLGRVRYDHQAEHLVAIAER